MKRYITAYAQDSTTNCLCICNNELWERNFTKIYLARNSTCLQTRHRHRSGHRTACSINAQLPKAVASPTIYTAIGNKCTCMACSSGDCYSYCEEHLRSTSQATQNRQLGYILHLSAVHTNSLIRGSLAAEIPFNVILESSEIA
jgi:hypothetical protein